MLRKYKHGRKAKEIPLGIITDKQQSKTTQNIEIETVYQRKFPDKTKFQEFFDQKSQKTKDSLQFTNQQQQPEEAQDDYLMKKKIQRQQIPQQFLITKKIEQEQPEKSNSQELETNTNIQNTTELPQTPNKILFPDNKPSPEYSTADKSTTCLFNFGQNTLKNTQKQPIISNETKNMESISLFKNTNSIINVQSQQQQQQQQTTLFQNQGLGLTTQSSTDKDLFGNLIQQDKGIFGNLLNKANN